MKTDLPPNIELAMPITFSPSCGTKAHSILSSSMPIDPAIQPSLIGRLKMCAPEGSLQPTTHFGKALWQALGMMMSILN